MAIGIALGHVVPVPFQALGGMKVVEGHLPVAVRIWLMTIPMLLKIDFAALGTRSYGWYERG